MHAPIRCTATSSGCIRLPDLYLGCSNSGGCSEIIKPYYTTDPVPLSRKHERVALGLTSSMRVNATRRTFREERRFRTRALRIFSPLPLPRARERDATHDAHGARCEINDAAQLGVINRGIIMVAIINIASLVCDNRSCQVTKLRLK